MYLRESQHDVHLIVRGRCGGADDGGAAAAQPNEWIPAPSATAITAQTLYTKRIFSTDAIDSSLTASAQPPLPPLMSHKPRSSTVNLVLQPPAAQKPPLQARRHSSPPPRFLQHMDGMHFSVTIPATRPRCPGSCAGQAVSPPSHQPFAAR